MMPSPNSPQPDFPRLVEQSVARKNGLKKHKATLLAFQATLETTLEDTVTPLPDDRPTSLIELCTPSSDTGECSIATAVLEASGEHDPIEDGFAALRAQRAARKKHLRELKRSAAHVGSACERASLRYTREAAPPSESV